MSKKYFCDVCGREVVDSVGNDNSYWVRMSQDLRIGLTFKSSGHNALACRPCVAAALLVEEPLSEGEVRAMRAPVRPGPPEMN